MGIVSPIAAVIGAAIPVVVGLLQGDRPGIRGVRRDGARGRRDRDGRARAAAPTDDARHQKVSTRALVLAILAGIGIGGFMAVISLAPDDSGLWSVVWARGDVDGDHRGARRRRGAAGADAVPPAARRRCGRRRSAAGVLDVGANAIYVLALQIGLLSVVSVLGSLYPAATVLLARFVLAERLRPMQKVGMVTAIVAAALLALG